MRGQATSNYGLELFHITELKKRWREVEDGKIYELFSYLLNNVIFSFFLKGERDWELMTSLSSELKNLGPWKKGENFLVFLR